MSHILESGQLVQTASGMPCTVLQYLGGGGQGEVYRGEFDGNQVALKWYFQATSTVEQYTALQSLIKKGPPNESFLWPIEMCTDRSKPGFGYIMRLRDSSFKSIVDLMKGRIDPSFRALTTACRELAHSFLQLHSKGLSYCDISFGNVFFDPSTGRILICDNDNVIVDGERPSIGGTPRFMAPEIVLGKARPSTDTDLYSLAVLLFYILMVHHPLDGAREAAIRCLDMPAMERLYGSEALFIFDPSDASNRPDPTYHKNANTYWPIYPEFVRQLFVRSFTDGIRDPKNGRVRESEWRIAMAKLCDAIVYCSNCGKENFAGEEQMHVTINCWNDKCRRAIQLPSSIMIGRYRVMLNHDTILYEHHVNEDRKFDYSAKVGELSRNPKDPSQWGLKNLSPNKWVATLIDGSVRDVEPGRSVRLASGTKIQFGGAEGVIT